MLPDPIPEILLRLNMASWRTSMHGGHRFVVFQAVHRQTGQEYVSRAAIHAEDAVRWLAVRCSVPTAGSAEI